MDPIRLEEHKVFKTGYLEGHKGDKEEMSAVTDIMLAIWNIKPIKCNKNNGDCRRQKLTKNSTGIQREKLQFHNEQTKKYISIVVREHITTPLTNYKVER